ncbi:CDP-glycerol glycerophosphotransferase family protein [Stenotrophomonas sp. HITSZ_GD]|uniref:CDP-glycerol glycerophosphotransferase family protein n=1 Tax=Stenotrophomonas sp. HITSZ_GD TaxID=3037248 RepID=UPI00240E1C59|nr:CDP-glycerol glycerophosphotransferase family protein [Stenotrophomonas sp. HITSZ_GD]MDG2526525.1 CDP-glycerol glycerophosphotransferase family protein [Stenotrophomonas sp. HITSZ_GD]
MTPAAATPVAGSRLPAWLARGLLALWRLLDLLVPKRGDHWAFFTHPLKPGQFIENSRAVFEQVKADPALRKCVFVRASGARLHLEDARNTVVLPLASPAGLWALARCRVLLLTNSTSLDMSLQCRDGSYVAPRPLLRRRVVVNLWHGIPLKRLFALAHPRQRAHGDRDAFRRQERRHYAGLIASSDVDGYAMSAIFHPIPPDNVWITGLPRNDFLRQPEAALPRYQREALATLRAATRGRRLVLYAPTYRDAHVTGTAVRRFDDGEVARLKALLRAHGAVLGVRGHYLRNAPAPFAPEHHDEVLIDLGHAQHEEIAPLLREASLVLTDYSSVYIDALYLRLPVISFAWDLDHYRQHQNGLLYDMDLAFPGPVTTDFDGLLQALDAALGAGSPPAGERYEAARRLFFRHDDDANARRVVERLHAVLAGATA